MTSEIHPLLRVIESLIGLAAPDPRWGQGESVSVGVATVEGPQWLTATRHGSTIGVAMSDDAPECARAKLVIKDSAARTALGLKPVFADDCDDIECTPRRNPDDVEDACLLGDAVFFRLTLVGALGQDSPLGLRLREVSK